jgi:hypothetical protein
LFTLSGGVWLKASPHSQPSLCSEPL